VDETLARMESSEGDGEDRRKRNGDDTDQLDWEEAEANVSEKKLEALYIYMSLSGFLVGANKHTGRLRRNLESAEAASSKSGFNKSEAHDD